MVYKKGNIPWIKGRKLSEETRLKMSEASRKRMQNPEYRKKATEHFIGNKFNVGKKLTEEHKRKVSESLKAVFAVRNGGGWKGGQYKNQAGYLLIFKPEHPNSSKRHYIMQHRLVMEEHLGRYLTKDEVVHHINGIHDDNRIENLVLFENSRKHRGHHNKLRVGIV